MTERAELNAAVTAARTKAQNAAEALRLARENASNFNLNSTPTGVVDVDLAKVAYDRAIAELEDAINAAGD